MIVENYSSFEVAPMELLARVRLASLSLAIASDRRNRDGTATAVRQLRAAFHAADVIAPRIVMRGGAWMVVLLRAAKRWGRVIKLHPYPALGDWLEDFAGILASRHLDARWAELHDLDLDELDLAFGQFCGAKLERVSAIAARLDAANLSLARVSRCRLSRSSMIATDLDDTELTAVDLSGGLIGCGSWRRAVVTSCSFTEADLSDANLENAWFSDCSFRSCNFAIAGSQRVTSNAGVRFVRCDLRDTNWTGRDLTGATFVDCAFHGARGAPALGDARIEGGDVSRFANRSVVGTRDQIAADWTVGVGVVRA